LTLNWHCLERVMTFIWL